MVHRCRNDLYGNRVDIFSGDVGMIAFIIGMVVGAGMVLIALGLMFMTGDD